MLQTDGFDADTAAMLRQIYEEVCAQYVSLAPDEQGMRETIAAPSKASPATDSARESASCATPASRLPSSSRRLDAAPRRRRPPPYLIGENGAASRILVSCFTTGLSPGGGQMPSAVAFLRMATRSSRLL